MVRSNPFIIQQKGKTKKKKIIYQHFKSFSSKRFHQEKKNMKKMLQSLLYTFHTLLACLMKSSSIRKVFWSCVNFGPSRFEYLIGLNLVLKANNKKKCFEYAFYSCVLHVKRAKRLERKHIDMKEDIIDNKKV